MVKAEVEGGSTDRGHRGLRPPEDRHGHRLPNAAGPTAPDLAILETRVYRGPNLWSYEPADPPRRRPRQPRGLPHQHPPRLRRRGCSSCCPAWPGTPARAAYRGGFLERLHEGTWLGHVAEHVALQLQQEAGHDIRRGKTRRSRAAAASTTSSTATATSGSASPPAQLAVRLINHLVRPRGRLRLRRAAARASCARPSGWRSARRPRRSSRRRSAATSRGSASTSTPWCSSARASTPQRIRATMTSRTGALAVDIAGDKDLTTKLLASAGLPVPRSESVRTVEAAVAAADRIGYPVVVKPLDGNHGRGVCLDLAAPTRSAPPSTSPRTSPAAAASSSSPSSPAATTAASSWAAGCRPSPSGCRPTSSATASTPCPSWSTSPTPTPGGASGTRRC